MAEATASPSQGTLQGDAPTLRLNLQVVSPSVGVSRPLNFPYLLAATTVGELKELIRTCLPIKPTDDQQRLIHRGRLLARDDETLEHVFGTELLRSSDQQQTLHLVLRDLSDPPAPGHGQLTPARGQSPAPAAFPNRPPEPGHHHHPQARLGRTTPTPGFPNVQGPIPSFGHPALTQHLQIAQQQHQTMVQWMNQLQREAGYRQLVNQQQRERAAMGRQGIQDNGQNPPGQGQTDNTSGRNSPAVGLPLGQPANMVGPNGQYWRTTAGGGEGLLSPNTNPPQPGASPVGRLPLLPAEVQNIIQGADASQATHAMTNAMHRSASGASLANMANINAPIHPIPPGVTTPLLHNASRHGSRTATPDPSLRTPSHGNSFIPIAPQTAPQSQMQTQPSQSQPEVYILSSPTGPRAILINSTAETYFTPRVQNNPLTAPGRHHLPPFYNFTPYPYMAQPNALPLQPGATPSVALQRRQQQVLRQAHNTTGAPANNALPAAAPPLNLIHPPNQGAGALIAAVWPHIWLMLRLAVFVWWCTSTDSSWSRLIIVVLMAIAVFIVNTGWLNGPANQAWDPFRRHLEGLLPLADPPGAAAAAAVPPGNAQNAAAGLRDGQHGAAPQLPSQQPAAAGAEGAGNAAAPLDPTQTAARLVARRQHANANWLMDQVRRVERAGLLFLASIAPGVAERHIAHLEAQERAAAAERARREAEETAAREARETEQAQAPPNGSGETNNNDDRTADGGNDHPQQSQPQQQQQQQQRRQEGPLIPI